MRRLFSLTFWLLHWGRCLPTFTSLETAGEPVQKSLPMEWPSRQRCRGRVSTKGLTAKLARPWTRVMTGPTKTLWLPVVRPIIIATPTTLTTLATLSTPASPTTLTTLITPTTLTTPVTLARSVTPTTPVTPPVVVGTPLAAAATPITAAATPIAVAWGSASTRPKQKQRASQPGIKRHHQ